MRRLGPNPRERVRRGGLARHVLHLDRDVDALGALEPLRVAGELRVAQRIGRGRDEPRLGEREQEADSDEDRRRGDPPAVAQRPGEPHHDPEREADEEELDAEADEVPDHPLDVARPVDVVPPLPPEAGDPERQLREPDDREAEHPRAASRCRCGRRPTRG